MPKKPANPQPDPENLPAASGPETQPGAPALDAEASPPAPEPIEDRMGNLTQPAPGVTREEFDTLKARFDKAAAILQLNYGVRI